MALCRVIHGLRDLCRVGRVVQGAVLCLVDGDFGSGSANFVTVVPAVWIGRLAVVATLGDDPVGPSDAPDRRFGAPFSSLPLNDMGGHRDVIACHRTIGGYRAVDG
jgi:hypothetical protein